MVRRGPACLLMTMAATVCLAAQDTPVLDAAKRGEILDAMADALNRLYVFPEVAARIDKDLRQRASRGEFDKATEPGAFAGILTRRLEEIAQDMHLRVRLNRVGSPTPITPRSSLAPSGAGSGDGRGGPGQRSIFGRAERLRGDIAYVEILTFAAPPQAVREAAPIPADRSLCPMA